MHDRCSNKNSKNYPYYGGRGISVCERWGTFPPFLEDVGRKPHARLTLDRYPNNDGNYEPGNVRWATRAEQSRNRRPFKVDGNKIAHAKRITVDGVTDNMTGWARRSGLPRAAIRSRLKAGWTPERAVTEASRERGFAGASHPNSKLTADSVLDIRKSRVGGEKIAAIAARFGVAKATVLDVVAGRTWRHVS